MSAHLTLGETAECLTDLGSPCAQVFRTMLESI